MKNLTTILRVLTVILFTVVTGCKGDEEEPQLKLPSDLQVAVTAQSDGSGNVSVTATAKDASYFMIYFGETANETPVLVENGQGTHKYSASGTYTIKVQAHVSASKFISKEQTVNVVVSTGNVQTGYTTPLSYPGMTLVWQDEFNGTTLNTADWTYETGGHGWGNNELQFYRPENTTVADGLLTITARKESFSGSQYTSSRLITKDKKDFKYGRVDIRAMLPRGQGIWPALWMLGSNISTVNWPACGEIDIMEMIGGSGREKTVHGTLHWADAGNAHVCTCDKPGYSLTSGTFADKFYVFTITWTETTIKWYVDDVKFNEIDITPAAMSEFRNNYFFIFNVAVGGNWPGSPDGTTTFPQNMVVDYVRVFQAN